MALLSCSECNKQISDKAPACPHCGASKGKATEQVTGSDAVNLLVSFIIGVFFAAFTMNLVNDDNEGLKLGVGLISLATPPVCALVRSNRRKI